MYLSGKFVIVGHLALSWHIYKVNLWKYFRGIYSYSLEVNYNLLGLIYNTLSSDLLIEANN